MIAHTSLFCRNSHAVGSVHNQNLVRKMCYLDVHVRVNLNVQYVL